MVFFAHYDQKTGNNQKLGEHLENVAVGAQLTVPPTVSFSILPNFSIKRLSYLAGKFHDLGKFTKYFQDYLLYEKDSRLKHHAHISALTFYRYLKVNSTLKFSGNQQEKEAVLFLAYLVVRQHHQNLSLKGLFSDSYAMTMWKELSDQARDLLNKNDIILKTLGMEEQNIEISNIIDIETLRTDRQLTNQPARFKNRRFSHEKWYFLLLYLFSLLIDSDKLDSAQIARKPLNDLPSQRVPEFIHEKHPSDSTNQFVDRRDEARRTIVSQVENLNKDELQENRIFTLTAPTGLGKTLSSLQAALILRERLSYIYHYKPRMITAIPFINIINQTNEDYEKVLGREGDIVVHHRLADLKAANDDKEEKMTLDKAFLEVESWEGDVVLTTFVQLFQSLMTGHNRRLKKINKLAGSIVVLDEIQSIPEIYMPLIGACLLRLSEYYGTRFILMTATQPKILELGEKLIKKTEPQFKSPTPVRLLPDHKKYFTELARSKILPRLSESMDTEEFVSFFNKTWGKHSSLIVVNTIKRSIELFEALRDSLPNHVNLLYLSTNIIPKHRGEVIKKAKTLLKNKQPVVMISTQTIEAGVDLDFEIGYRDLAPLESIIQTAGRVNRKGDFVDKNGAPVTSPVYVMELEADHQYVYQLHHLHKTKDLLQKHDKNEILEKNYQSLVREYYDSMLNNPLPSPSKKIWTEGVRKLNFEEIEQFQLIECPGEIVDVFIELDQDASALADAYEEIRQLKREYDLNVFDSIVDQSFLKDASKELSPFERKSILRLVMAKLSEYMVQVRLEKLFQNKPFAFSWRNGIEADFFWVPREQYEDYYNLETGLIADNEKALIF